jgi:hypothetical protein
MSNGVHCRRAGPSCMQGWQSLISGGSTNDLPAGSPRAEVFGYRKQQIQRQKANLTLSCDPSASDFTDCTLGCLNSITGRPGRPHVIHYFPQLPCRSDSTAAASDIPDLKCAKTLPLSTSIRIQNGVTEVSAKSPKLLYLNPFN